MATLTYHDAANIFPMMVKSELESLASDIKANGQQEPIEKHNGAILDGRNRYEACLIAGVTPEFVEWSGADPITYVISRNLHRRHLTESQRSMIAARYKKTITKKQLETVKTESISGANLPPPSTKSRDIAGKALNVSGRSINAAQKVIDKGSSSLAKAVDDGNLPVSVAAKVAELPKKEQNKVAKSSDPKKAAKEATKAPKSNAEQASKLRSVIKQHNAAMIRAIDDLNDLVPHKKYHEDCLSRFRDIDEIIRVWK